MRPPFLPRLLLRALTPREDRSFLLQDLDDEFALVERQRGPAAARRWYWSQARTSFWPLAASRFPQAPRVALLGQHARHAVRLLRLSPGTTIVAAVTLALAIGANTAVFSVVDAVMLRPLPYADPDRLVSLWQAREGARSSVALADYVEYERRVPVFDGLAAYDSTTGVIRTGGAPEELPGNVVSWNFLRVLGWQPTEGRGFTQADAAPAAQPVAILSEACWRIHFGADPAVLGRTMLVDDTPRTIVGILPAAFTAPSHYTLGTDPMFFVPATAVADVDAIRGDHDLLVVGRLAADATAAQAQRQLRQVDDDLARRYPRSNADVRALVAPLGADVARRVRLSLLMLATTVGLVVFIAALNVANLLIVRALGQRQEVAVRLALGATRGDIAVDYLVRGLALAALGGLAGVVAASWTRDLLLAFAPPSMPRLEDVAINGRVLIGAAVLTGLAGVLAGVAPALQVVRGAGTGGLNVTERAGSLPRATRRWQGALLACEIAAAVVVTLGAGLLVRSLLRLDAVDLGFQTDRVLTFRIRPSDPGFAGREARLRFFDLLAERIERLPGVDSVAFANNVPMRGGWGGGLLVDAPSGPLEAEADMQAVSDGYFATLGIPIVRGRGFTRDDRTGAPPVVVVSRSFAARFVGGRDPIGVRIRRDLGAPALTIVGVAGDIRRDGKLAEPTPQVFFAARQIERYPVSLGMVAVRSSVAEPRSLLPAIRDAASSIAPADPISGVRTLDELLTASMATRRFDAVLLGSFAVLALVLAVVGVYGVVAHAAAQRTREIGLRVALGATAGNVVTLIVAGGLRWTLPGITAGLVAAYASTRLMTALLFQVAPTDPLTFSLVAALMLGVSLLASYLPARRAARLDPLAALRTE